MGAYNIAQEAYCKMQKVYRDMKEEEIYEARKLIKVAEIYANLENIQGNDTETISTVWELDGNEYDTYNSFVYIPSDYNRFIEDLTMMIYRLYGGEGYNTYSLIAEINR